MAIGILMLGVSSVSCWLPPAAAQENNGILPAEIVHNAQVGQLGDVLIWTYENNPSLRAARAELLAVHEEMPQAMAGWKPRVDATGNITNAKIDGSNFGGEGTTTKEVELGFNQPLYRGGRTVAAMGQASALIGAQRALLRSFEQQVLRNVATAYMDVVRDRAVLDLRSGNERVIRKNLEATQARFGAGELTRTDVAQSEARLARAEADRIRAAGDLKSSEASYEQVVGQRPAQTLVTPVLKFPIPPTLDEAVTLAEQQNPDVIAAKHLHLSAEENVEEVFGELLPELSFLGAWNRQFDPQPGLLKESTTSTIGVSASVPLYSAGGVRSRVRQAKHTANQKYMEIIDSRRTVRQQVITSWEDLASAGSEILSRKSQVEAARLAQQGVNEEATLGARSILDALDADQELLDAQVAQVTAERDRVVAEFALAAVLGLLTPQTLGTRDFSGDYDAHLDAINWKILGIDVDHSEIRP